MNIRDKERDMNYPHEQYLIAHLTMKGLMVFRDLPISKVQELFAWKGERNKIMWHFLHLFIFIRYQNTSIDLGVNKGPLPRVDEYGFIAEVSGTMRT